MDGGEPPIVPALNDLSDFLRMVKVTRPADGSNGNITEYRDLFFYHSKMI